MLRSKKLGLFTAVLLCLACVMLFHWSQGRAHQNAGMQQHLVNLGLALQADPYLNRVNDPMPQAANAAQVNKLSEYWIGVDGSPADDVLRAQLDLPAGRGLVVNQIVPKSPAETAGLKQYDALLAADDKPISQISDLASLVQERKETAITLKLMRSAKPLTIEVTPQRRPANQTGETCPQMSPLDDPEFVRRVYLDVLGVVPTAEDLNVFLHDFRDDKRSRLANELLRRSTITTKSCTACHAGHQASDLHRWIAGYDVGAGRVSHGQIGNLVDFDNDGQLDLYIANGPLAVTVQAPQLPDELTITITHKGKEPAKVQVTRGDQSWGTTENKMSELPEDIRGYVSQFFVTPRAVSVQPLATYREAQDHFRWLVTPRNRTATVMAVPSVSPSTTASTATASDTHKSSPQGAPVLAEVESQLKTLTQQLEQLQKTLDELRKSPAAPPAKPDGEPEP